LHEGTLPKQLKGLASAELTNRVTREAETKARLSAFLGLK
jgi:carboxyvinyl-carboxyphosphonate phosphorylmutase